VSNQRVTDEIILEGFRSLAQAMSEGFDNIRLQLTAEISALRSEMNQRFAKVDQRFAEVHERIGGLEHRMMRRFDEVGGRVDDHERRITTLEAKR
jgi:malate synthase